MDAIAKQLWTEVASARSTLADLVLTVSDAEARLRSARDAFLAHVNAAARAAGLDPNGAVFDVETFTFKGAPDAMPTTGDAEA